MACAEAGGTELHVHRKSCPSTFSLGWNQALLHSSRLPTAGEAAGPRSVLALLSGGTVAGAQDQARETQQAFYLSIIYSLLSSSALLFRCLENPKSWDQEMSCTKYACPGQSQNLFLKVWREVVTPMGSQPEGEKTLDLCSLGVKPISFLQVQLAF